jgi:hypothetical protein
MLIMRKKYATDFYQESGELNPDIAVAIYCGLAGYWLESHYNNYIFLF